MPDFPRSLIEFQSRFPDEAACVAYLFTARWRHSFVCPACGGSKAWQLQTKAWTWECAGCGKQTSVTAGTVEVDETEIVCRSKNDPLTGGGGRSHQGKILVVGAVEIEDGGAGPGRIRLSQVPDYSARSLHSFLKTNLAPGATAKTDGWSGYPGAPGVNHDPHVVGKMAAHIILPWAHRVFSNLKIWALGVYHGLRRKHLQIYLDEFVFRFNRRHTRHAAFRSLLGIAAAHPPLTYNMLISPEAKA